ncbi:MAG: hypothetical protein M1838_001139 [Thelocarpon superellum]|nr:MAG: hypothetical protein M1838_001139 [Thelocarpon superellum]
MADRVNPVPVGDAYSMTDIVVTKSATYRMTGLVPDVRLAVFDTEFFVHSQVLRLHSGYFRTFLTPAYHPPRSDTSPPAHATIRYECGTKIDADAAWGLQRLSELPDLPRTSLFHAEHCRRAFQQLLDALYSRRSILCTMRELRQLVQLADFYLALPIVSTFVDANLHESPGLTRSIPAHATEALSLAKTIRSPVLFREAFVHAVGQKGLCTFNDASASASTHAPATLGANLTQLIDKHHGLLRARVAEASHALLCICSRTSDSESYDSSTLWAGMVERQIKEKLRSLRHSLSLENEAAFYGSLYENTFEPDPELCKIAAKHLFQSLEEVTRHMRSAATAAVRAALRPLMLNSLRLHSEPLYVVAMPLPDHERGERRSATATVTATPPTTTTTTGGSGGAGGSGSGSGNASSSLPPYFLCTDVSNEELPWDEAELDW